MERNYFPIKKQELRSKIQNFKLNIYDLLSQQHDVAKKPSDKNMGYRVKRGGQHLNKYPDAPCD